MLYFNYKVIDKGLSFTFKMSTKILLFFLNESSLLEKKEFKHEKY